jgi:ABC-type multidrug transport system ATPase subunit
MSAGEHVLALDRVGKRFGSHDVLRNLSLDIAPGSVVGLLGSNGAGKTTAMSILSWRRPHDARSRARRDRVRSDRDPKGYRRCIVRRRS